MNYNHSTFQRYEMKYLFSIEKYPKLLQLLGPYLKQDEFGLHTICNIYYDTEHFDLIRNSIEKPVYKEKLRLRSYGIPAAEDHVFVELKKKYKGVVYKRRIRMKYEEALHYLESSFPCILDSQISREIDWFLTQYHPKPKVFLACDRIAHVGIEDPELRVTFDQKIRYREEKLDLSAGDEGTLLLAPDQVLMEIKIPGAMPLWMSQILTQLEIYPVSFSKYGICFRETLYRQMIADEANKGGMTCA